MEYQIARGARENQIIQNYNNQGITENYPQPGTNFWGSSPENNYGFGTSKIHDNIENMQNQTNWVNNSNNTQWGMNNTSLGLQNNELGNKQETLWYENLANEASKFGKIFAKEIKSDLADVGYGAKKALNGLTLGGSDWVMRRLGMDNEDEYLAQKDAEGTGVAARIGGTVSEIGGNMLGAGTGIVKGLGKLGLTGTKLAGVSGLVEGGITGAANSDTWSELPQKMLTGSALGLIGGVAGQKVLDMVIKPFDEHV